MIQCGWWVTLGEVSLIWGRLGPQMIVDELLSRTRTPRFAAQCLFQSTRAESRLNVQVTPGLSFRPWDPYPSR